MSTANAKNGSAIEPRATLDTNTTPRAPTRRPTAVLQQDQGLLLAQIPDLDSAAAPRRLQSVPTAGSSARRYRSSSSLVWELHS